MEKFPVISSVDGAHLHEFTYFIYSHSIEEYFVIVCGDVAGKREVPLRIQGSCFLAETFGGAKCDCKAQLDLSVKIVKEFGIFIYVRLPEFRSSMTCYVEEGPEFIYDGIGPILTKLKVESVLLYTENDKKITACGKFVETVRPLPSFITPYNTQFLREKESRREENRREESRRVEGRVAKRVDRIKLGISALLGEQLDPLLQGVECRIPSLGQIPFAVNRLFEEGAEIILVVGQVRKKFLVPMSTIIINLSVQYRIPIVNGLYLDEPVYSKCIEEISEMSKLLR